MKKVTIFGVGNIGVRVAYFLARSREIASIRLVDVDPERSRATTFDFLQSNVALQSKIAFSPYDEPKEISQSDVVIVAAGVKGRADSNVEMPPADDITMMNEIATHIGHFAPEAVVAIISQPAELFSRILQQHGFIDPQRIIGFPLLIYREWFRDHLARVVGMSHEDIRITTVRTLQGEDLVKDQCSVSGVPLVGLLEDEATLPSGPGQEEIHSRVTHHHYSPAAVVSEVTTELVAKRRQVITCVAMHPDQDAFLECKAVVGPEGVEHVLELALESEQRRRHEEYRKRVVELTRKLA